ncbi:MAG: heme a synthase [Alphaproteobacteria bacterium]|jgi:cytochrome c oxidase assembly protein subunit 15|nr:heme a synthase [Alphaproteobacteria bacterium]
MNFVSPDIDLRRRAIRLWLLAVAALVFIMVLVGGATRLTESGLSIVEWKPVAGALPPLTDNEWVAEFEKYKAIPQYQQLNRGMSLDEFKTIFWWEWAHRFLGRVIGAAFLLPFLWFLWRGWIEPRLRPRLWIIFALGAFQGAVGWWMVASGLAERVSVSQYRLAFHLTLACLIYVALLWTAQRLSPRAPLQAPRRLSISAAAILLMVLVQIYLGALVAGLDAGLVYNTWPLIDGNFIPEGSRLLFNEPPWRNFFENALTVQFDHRMMAYALWLAAILYAIDAARCARGRVFANALLLAGAITIQANLGILTLLYQAPLSLALAHQAMALVVLTIATLHAQRLEARRAGDVVAVAASEPR